MVSSKDERASIKIHVKLGDVKDNGESLLFELAVISFGGVQEPQRIGNRLFDATWESVK